MPDEEMILFALKIATSMQNAFENQVIALTGHYNRSSLAADTIVNRRNDVWRGASYVGLCIVRIAIWTQHTFRSAGVRADLKTLCRYSTAWSLSVFLCRATFQAPIHPNIKPSYGPRQLNSRLSLRFGN